MARIPFRRITIVGVGLIGGSLGMAVRRKLPSVEVTGFDRSSVLRQAIRRGAIDKAEGSLPRAVRSADLVVLATPISSILKFLPVVAKNISPSAIVTDVGSVKKPVTQLADRLFPNGNFVGGHPMAGTEHSGIGSATPGLLNQSFFVLTPTIKTSRRAQNTLKTFLRKLGVKVATLEPMTHDRVVSALSHLPQLAAVAMMNVTGSRHADARKYLKLAAGGFRDMTRIASSDVQIWKDILNLNKKEIVRALEMYIKELGIYRLELKKNLPAVRMKFVRAQRLRKEMMLMVNW